MHRQHSYSSRMSERKAVIKNADMSEDMQQDAVDCASQALEKYNIEKVRIRKSQAASRRELSRGVSVVGRVGVPQRRPTVVEQGVSAPRARYPSTSSGGLTCTSICIRKAVAFDLAGLLPAWEVLRVPFRAVHLP